MPAKAKNKPGARVKLNNLLLTEEEYQQVADQHKPKTNILRNCLRAFLVGGFICFIGQCIQQLFMTFADMSAREAASPTVAILILISIVLTSFGVYDKIAQWAGAGTAVPVTGFANSMCSSAIESRAEGLVLGVGANMFKLAGSVIVFGVVAAFIVGVIHVIFGLGGVH
ncbi:stage V sporulation protein AC [Paenibacillus phoenicis]|uniref:Stage V sporulation protein AC n=1 Tax=Paenibacillus phoenicis TaxID=554117 RepID=A0ABU5PKV8_9BACL|nr:MULTISPECIES: stage V sporulation protein AC [Paenibacillus]EES73768.1 stage V sporulation protein AC [Paenibacillus sp. oral taxon 786 str. D14]MEA3570392.1 stage V sporulation protein AC [Paenibacillus phoenicis]